MNTHEGLPVQSSEVTRKPYPGQKQVELRLKDLDTKIIRPGSSEWKEIPNDNGALKAQMFEWIKEEEELVAIHQQKMQEQRQREYAEASRKLKYQQKWGGVDKFVRTLIVTLGLVTPLNKLGNETSATNAVIDSLNTSAEQVLSAKELAELKRSLGKSEDSALIDQEDLKFAAEQQEHQVIPENLVGSSVTPETAQTLSLPDTTLSESMRLHIPTIVEWSWKVRSRSLAYEQLLQNGQLDFLSRNGDQRRYLIYRDSSSHKSFIESYKRQLHPTAAHELKLLEDRLAAASSEIFEAARSRVDWAVLREFTPNMKTSGKSNAEMYAETRATFIAKLASSLDKARASLKTDPTHGWNALHESLDQGVNLAEAKQLYQAQQDSIDALTAEDLLSTMVQSLFQDEDYTTAEQLFMKLIEYNGGDESILLALAPHPEQSAADLSPLLRIDTDALEALNLKPGQYSPWTRSLDELVRLYLITKLGANKIIVQSLPNTKRKHSAEIDLTEAGPKDSPKDPEEPPSQSPNKEPSESRMAGGEYGEVK